jgi:hypothetical protein
MKSLSRPVASLPVGAVHLVGSLTQLLPYQEAKAPQVTLTTDFQMASPFTPLWKHVYLQARALRLQTRSQLLLGPYVLFRVREGVLIRNDLNVQQNTFGAGSNAVPYENFL